MNERLVEVIIRAKDMTASVVNRFRASMRQIGTVIKDASRAMVEFVAGTTAMVFGLTKVAQQGAKVNDVKAAFARITGDETAALQQLRRATGGTISDLELMAEHNQQLALGTAKSTEEFARMLRISKELGDALGIEGPDAMNRFADVLASGSARAARALGLEIKEGMTQNEILEAAEELVRRLSGAQSAGAEAADRFAAAIKNGRDRLSEFVAESPLVAGFLDTLASVVDTIAGALARQDWKLLADTFQVVGETMGDALIFGVNKALQKLPTGSEWMEKIPVLRQWARFERFAQDKFFGGGAEHGATNLGVDMTKLQAIFARGQAGDAAAAAASGVLPGIDVNVPGKMFGERLFDPIARRAFTGQDVTLQGQILSRRSQIGGVTIPRLAPRLTIDPEEAANKFEGASEVFVASVGAMTESAVRGSKLTADSIIQMMARIAQSLPGIGGLAGAAIGAVGGIFGALFGGRKEPVRVMMDDVSDRAAQKLAERGGGPTRITTIIEQGGVEIERIERELHDRSNRDEVVRFSRGRAVR